MPGRFEGKVAIVTGSSNGIGRATALLMAQEGAEVVIHGRSEQSMNDTLNLLVSHGAKPDDIHSVRGDITLPEVQNHLIDETVAKFGKIDILVNNAGASGPPNSVSLQFDRPIEDYDYVMNLNTRTPLVLTKLAMPHLIAAKGEVIMISSIAGLNMAAQYLPYYAAAKAALNQLTRSLAVAYIGDGVRVNAIWDRALSGGKITIKFCEKSCDQNEAGTTTFLYSPGIIRTAILEKFGATQADNDMIFDGAGKNTNIVPCGFTGEPFDIANTVAFLADRSVSRFIIGQTLAVDGGTSLLNPMMQSNFLAFKQ